MTARKKRDVAATSPRQKAKPALIEESWGGRTNYRCSRCPFASLDRELALEHVLGRHGVREAS
jgi:hypothetical protein